MKPAEATDPIGDDEAHLWYGDPGEISDPGLLQHLRGLLSQDEQEKIDRYRRASDRHTGLIARAAVRSLLSRYVAVDPAGWQFRANRHGRPEIAEPSCASAFRFNIAHTAGMLTVLVSRNRDLGVDVESLPYLGPYLDIAERYFAPDEVSALRSLPSSEQAARFIEYWTLKESFIKARGMGLAMPLNAFAFDLGDETRNRIEIRFADTQSDDPKRWQFGLKALGHSHIVATAIQRRRDERVRVAWRALCPPTWVGEKAGVGEMAGRGPGTQPR